MTKKRVLHFAHANGFPAACYGELLHDLKKDHTVIFKPMLAHDPEFPVVDGWKGTADEIIQFIENSTTEKVVGLGHSLGATATLIAACDRPDLFERIILLDPVLLVGLLPATLVKVLKRIDRIGMLTPANKTMARRRNWRSREEALSYFEGKALFKNFTEISLKNYVEHGLKPDGDGFNLVFDVATEVRIFETVPHDIDRLAAKPLQVPGTIIRGTRSEVARLAFVKRVAKAHNMGVHSVKGSHMFPFEIPTETVEAIRRSIHIK